MFNNEDDFQLFREEALVFEKKRIERVVKEFLEEIGFVNGTVGYEKDSRNKMVNFYTKSPGVLIGKGGKNVEIIKEKMKNEYGGDWKIEFIEVCGGFITV